MQKMREISTTSYVELQKDLEHWFQTALGRTMLANQRHYLAAKIDRYYGLHQLELGVSHRIPMGNSSSLGHKVFVLPRWEPEMPGNTLISLSHEIALENNSIDVVIMHHVLDFAAKPHQTLREAARILRPGGKLVLMGFNPISTWGVRRVMSRGHRSPWNSRFISGGRVEDWLRLLGFAVGEIDYHFFAPPVTNQAILARFRGMDLFLNSRVPFGAYYMLAAEKQEAAKLPTQIAWPTKAKVIGMPVANRLTSRNEPQS